VISVNRVLVVLIGLILLVFAYAFWIGAHKSPSEGGPSVVGR
jgi:hypothetical protein